jgi:hypothetical protein
MQAMDMPGVSGGHFCCNSAASSANSGQAAGQLRDRQAVNGCFSKRDEMQAPAALRVVTPGLPGGQKVQPEAKAGFEDDEAVLALPALRQFVAARERHGGPAPGRQGRVVDIVEGEGVWRAVGVKFQAGRLEFFH